MSEAPIPCRCIKPQFVIVRVSKRRYQIGQIDNSAQYSSGYTNFRRVALITPTLSHSEVYEWLLANPDASEPSEYQP